MYSMLESKKIAEAYGRMNEGVRPNGTIDDFSWEKEIVKRASSTVCSLLSKVFHNCSMGKYESFDHDFEIYDLDDGKSKKVTAKAVTDERGWVIVGNRDVDLSKLSDDHARFLSEYVRENHVRLYVEAILKNKVSMGSMDNLSMTKNAAGKIYIGGWIMYVEVTSRFFDDSRAWFIEQTGLGQYRSEMERKNAKYFAKNLRKPNFPDSDGKAVGESSEVKCDGCRRGVSENSLTDYDTDDRGDDSYAEDEGLEKAYAAADSGWKTVSSGDKDDFALGLMKQLGLYAANGEIGLWLVWKIIRDAGYLNPDAESAFIKGIKGFEAHFRGKYGKKGSEAGEVNEGKKKYKMWCNVCGKVIRTEDEHECPHCHTDDVEEYEGQDCEGVDEYDLFDTP